MAQPSQKHNHVKHDNEGLVDWLHVDDANQISHLWPLLLT